MVAPFIARDLGVRRRRTRVSSAHAPDCGTLAARLPCPVVVARVRSVCTGPRVQHSARPAAPHLGEKTMTRHLPSLAARGAAEWPTTPLPPDAVLRPAAAGGDTIQVTLVGGDVSQRRRLADLLAQVAGIDVTGWSDTPRSQAVLEAIAGMDVVVAPTAPPTTVVRRPRLSPRQRDVLTAYSASNELLEVVARRLGMKAETFKTHLRRIRVKYEDVGRPAPTRRDLYVRAVQDGLLPPPA